MSNKSKAQRYAEAKSVPEFIWEERRYAYVNEKGGLSITLTEINAGIALKLRDWLTDTFDVPSTVKAINWINKVGETIDSLPKEQLVSMIEKLKTKADQFADLEKAIIIGSSMEKVKEDNWTKDIKPGFEGRTRDGRRAVFQGIREHCPEYMWSVEGSTFSHKYESLTTFNVHGIIESDWDIIGPWDPREEDGKGQ